MLPGSNGRLEPAAGIPLIAIPYDRDSILAALEARAVSPRPSTALLDSFIARFRVPFAAYAAISDTVAAMRDTLRRLKAGVDSLDRASPEYRQAYGAFVELTSRRTDAEKRQAAAEKALAAARRPIGARGDSARAALKAWENTTFSEYEQITANLTRTNVTRGVTDTTRSDGRATLTLPASGRWWIYARTFDATDPNAEWYWNVPVTGDSIVLAPANARRRNKY